MPSIRRPARAVAAVPWAVVGLAALAAFRPAGRRAGHRTPSSTRASSDRRPPVENGTLVVQRGKIVAVGAGVAIPAGAHVRRRPARC